MSQKYFGYEPEISLKAVIFFLDFSKMTDSDSTKVIEKLTEVLELLKKKEAKDVKKPEEIKETKPQSPVDSPQCSEKTCPLRKVLSEKEFNDMAQNMTKVDVVKVTAKCVDCPTGGCPFMSKCGTVPSVSFAQGKEEFIEELDTLNTLNTQNTPCKKGDCVQVINVVLSVILLILFFVFLFRALKGLYCNV